MSLLVSEIIQERLTEINADSFVWTKSVPLVPNVDFESVLDTYCEAAGSAYEDLGQSQSGSSTDRPVVAAPARPSASSSARSRSPVSRDPEHYSRVVVPKPPVPRPRVQGARTPVPPAPRPKHLGVRTPVPPVPSSGRPASGYLVSVPKHRARPPQDLDRDYQEEFPSIEESFVPKASGVSIDSGFVGDWTSEQWREYNRQQELASSAAASSSPADEPTFNAPVVRAIATLHKCIESAAELQSAIVSMDLSRVTHVVSLDFHKVIDRSWRCSVETFRTLGSRPEVCLIVLSKCADRKLIEDSFAYIRRLVEASDYSVRDLPILYIRDREGPNGKCSRLYDALRGTSLADLPVAHFDDKWPIVREFNGFGRYGWKGVWMDPRGRVELDAAVNNTLAEYRHLKRKPGFPSNSYLTCVLRHFA